MAVGSIFLCLVASVTDGDTFRCRDGTRVRMSGIDAPELGSCPPRRRCAPGNGQASKRFLERLISGRSVRCRRVGMSYNRVTAWCSVGGVDLSCRMVAAGYAVIDRRY